MGRNRNRRRPRQETVHLHVDHPGGELLAEIGPGGEYVRFRGPVLEASAHVTYERKKGAKTLAYNPQRTQELYFEPDDALRKNFDLLFAIDTNSRTIASHNVSITGVVIGEVLGPKQDAVHWTIPYCIEFVEPVHAPEKLGWAFVLQDISREPALQGNRVGLIVDAYLSELAEINRRSRPMYGGIFLPEGVQLVYASADVGREFVANKLLAEADKVATQLLREIEAGRIPFNEKCVDGHPYKACRKLLSSTTDYGNLKQRFPVLFRPGLHLPPSRTV